MDSADRTEVLLTQFKDLVKKDVAVPVAAMDALAGVIKRSDNVSLPDLLILLYYIVVCLTPHPHPCVVVPRRQHGCSWS